MPESTVGAAERAEAARLRRRADLLDGDPEFAAEAVELRLAADLAEQHATLCDELEETRAAMLAVPDSERFKSHPAVVAHKAKAVELHELRKTWRYFGEMGGARLAGGGPKITNHTEV